MNMYLYVLNNDINNIYTNTAREVKVKNIYNKGL